MASAWWFGGGSLCGAVKAPLLGTALPLASSCGNEDAALSGLDPLEWGCLRPVRVPHPCLCARWHHVEPGLTLSCIAQVPGTGSPVGDLAPQSLSGREARIPRHPWPHQTGECPTCTLGIPHGLLCPAECWPEQVEVSRTSCGAGPEAGGRRVGGGQPASYSVPPAGLE